MNLDYINELKNKKNLLAFSAGEDSSVLFELLVELNICFDLIMINYNLREQSKEEVNQAKYLSQKHNKKLYLKEIKMDSFNEEKARNIRYEYFDEIMESYDNLIFAHHANDRLEWFLMQLTKGAGLPEINSFKGLTRRNNYSVVRPLINITKEDILKYSQKNNIKTFLDETNEDETIKRNWFRHNISNKLMNEFSHGVINSFRYLDEDERLLEKVEEINTNIESYFKLIKSEEDILNLRAIDKIFKLEFKRVLTSKQRKEILNSNYDSVIDNIVIQKNDKEIHIAPYIKVTLPKDFKEKMRVNKIPAKIRGFLFNQSLIKD